MIHSNGWDPKTVESIASALAGKPGALMLVLHEVQRTLGYIPAQSVAVIARVLNLSRAEVHGVLTFYRDFRTEPPARHTIRVCRAESCQAMGAARLAAHAASRLGVAFGQATPDGAYSLEPVYCLGNCACSPAIMIDEELHGRVTPEKFDELLAPLEEVRR